MCLCLPWVLCKSLGCCLCVPWVLCLFLSWVLKGCCGTHLPSLISGLHFPAPSPNLLHLPCSAHGTQHITHQHPAPSTCTLSTSTQYSAPSTRHLAPCWDRQVSKSSQHLACRAGAVWLPGVNLGHDDQENLPESGSNSPFFVLNWVGWISTHMYTPHACISPHMYMLHTHTRAAQMLCTHHITPSCPDTLEHHSDT